VGGSYKFDMDTEIDVGSALYREAESVLACITKHKEKKDERLVNKMKGRRVSGDVFRYPLAMACDSSG
jgi:hypothetical protein